MRSATRAKLGKDPVYLAWIRTLPCMICPLVGVCPCDWEGCRNRHQGSSTEAAHVGDRGLSQKCPDNQTVPLCRDHHRLSRDSHHRAGRKFWTIWGLDRDAMILRYQSLYAASGGRRTDKRVLLHEINWIRRGMTA